MLADAQVLTEHWLLRIVNAGAIFHQPEMNSTGLTTKQ